MLAVAAVRGASVITDEAEVDILRTGGWSPMGLDYEADLRYCPREVAVRLLASIDMTVADMEAE